MLFPSPVAGRHDESVVKQPSIPPLTPRACSCRRGSRLFTLCHVLVHVVSVILSIVFVAEVSDHQSNNQGVQPTHTYTHKHGRASRRLPPTLAPPDARVPQIEADGAASILSLLLLLIGVVSIITLSVTSTTPFSAHGVTLALTLWAS